MKISNKNPLTSIIHAAVLLPSAAIGISLAIPATTAQGAALQLEEVIVTARRREESIQDVPISMTVFNQETLDQRNVSSATDLVKYTPSLNANTRFGSDQASFAIRGFTQEFRTTASVGVYFADVVAPRGGSLITAGDGAGPGAFFDLENVQVLKGPQGTLFGRNTTGGAIQLVPKKPTEELEGYVEASAGNYDMQRGQGVINIPISERVRARFGVDTNKRDGYIKNISGVGPDHLSDLDYLAARGSLVVDVTDTVENYSIFQYAQSENNGTLQGLFACNPASPLGFFCQQTLNSQQGDFYTVANGDHPDPTSELEQWQLINTTTWEVNDDLTVKNIISYADLEQIMRTSNFGTNFTLPPYGVHFSLFTAGQWGNIPTNSQTTFVEELQFSGTAMADRLTWQAGLYYENSRPDGWSATLSGSSIACPQVPGGDPSAWQCMDVLGAMFVAMGAPYGTVVGTMLSNMGKIEYTNKAAYAQLTYDISDDLRFTTGLRYTVDETEGTNTQTIYAGFPYTMPAAPLFSACVISTASQPGCKQALDQESDAPTWLIGLDYQASADLMLYGKYSRGYRQGSINMFGAEGVQSYEPEEVDAFEIGSKWSFEAPVPGTLNVALFYNDLTDQQIQVGYSGNAIATTTGIVNAGASTIQGGEVEANLELAEGLMLSLSYAYLDTKLDEISIPPIAPGSPFNRFNPSVAQGGDLTFSPNHTVSTTLSYRLPLAADIGDVTVGANYSYVDEQLSTVGTFGTLDSRNLINLNANWQGVVGSGFDLALFATNLTDEEYPVNVTGFYDDPQIGMDFRVTGEPRMYGARVKYNF